MDIVKEVIGDCVKLAISGRLVASNSDDFKKDVKRELDGYHKLLLDCSNLEYIDSSGIGALVAILQELSVNGSSMKLACLQPKPRILFDITKIFRVMDIYDNVEMALEAFKE